MDVVLAGVLELPDGSRVRGRGLRAPLPSGPVPSFGLYLGSRALRRRREPGMSWARHWLLWPDFSVPRDTDEATTAIVDLHRRAREGQTVEVACGGGVGRTGTVLACLTVLGGLEPDEAVAWVREHHHRRAVETPRQRRWVHGFARRTG